MLKLQQTEMFEKTKKPIVQLITSDSLSAFKKGKEWIPFVLWCAQMRSKVSQFYIFTMQQHW